MNTPISASDRPDSIPVLRLLPKANARAIRRGAPWVFDNELVMDRRTRKIAPGTIAVLEDHDREAMGVVAVNPTSKIVARMLDRNPLAVIDRDWLFAKLTKAVAMRDRMYDKPFYRLVHAEGDGLPGVIIDRFGDTAVIQPNAAWAEMLIEDLADALMAATGVANVLKNSAGRGRTLEGLDDVSTVLRCFRRIVQASCFQDWQRVHIRPQANNLARSGFAPLDHTNNAGAANAGDDLVTAKLL